MLKRLKCPPRWIAPPLHPARAPFRHPDLRALIRSSPIRVTLPHPPRVSSPKAAKRSVFSALLVASVHGRGTRQRTAPRASIALLPPLLARPAYDQSLRHRRACHSSAGNTGRPAISAIAIESLHAPRCEKLASRSSPPARILGPADAPAAALKCFRHYGTRIDLVAARARITSPPSAAANSRWMNPSPTGG